MGRNYDVITFISKYLYLKKPRVAIFADIIKIASMFNKTILKDSSKRFYGSSLGTDMCDRF